MSEQNNTSIHHTLKGHLSIRLDHKLEACLIHCKPCKSLGSAHCPPPWCRAVEESTEDSFFFFEEYFKKEHMGQTN